MDDQNKNLILATALSFLVILVWFVLFPPEEPPQTATTEVTATEQAAPETTAGGLAGVPTSADPASDAATATAGAATPQLADAPRIPIETPKLNGSISLLGGRIDELSLLGYRETLDEDSPDVTLLAPVGAERPYYTLYGWAPGNSLTLDDVPGTDTLWEVESGDKLMPGSTVTLRWNSPSGLIFRRSISVDDDYLFSVSQSVENPTDAAVRAAPYGIIARHGLPDLTNFFIQHEGLVALNDGVLELEGYDDITDMDVDPAIGARGAAYSSPRESWIGFTDKYWMTTLIPATEQPVEMKVQYQDRADIYAVQTIYPTLDIAAGATVTQESQLFAGAKEWEVIRGYQNNLGIAKFLDSIDWGWFFFLTKPIFAVLHWLNAMIGNMGWAIIALTLFIKAILFPLAFRSYVSMAKMKELQPQMEALKEKCGDDRQKLQQGMMELYKKEKVNPAAGCLPILLQIPIFFSLYKVIFVTLELRHAPWWGWIVDLSAPDPSSIINLFGILPFAVPELGFFEIFSLGILPILLGISMWLQQKLNPAPTDPTQQMIFAWMPWIFMFMLGTFASGLVIYWIANNTITFIQQYLIMRSQGYTPDVFGNIRSSFKKRDKPEAK